MENVIEAAILEFAANAHEGQKRKYTFEPYINHCMSVAQMVKDNKGTPSMGYAALLHDVVEDTAVTLEQIEAFLISIHILPFIAKNIVNMVDDLTDKFTKESHPHLNRKQRKELECQRLATINPKSQTIKYCDLIDNAGSILKHDANFAKTYLAEKIAILKVMDKGDHELYLEALQLTLNLNQLQQA